MSLTIRQLRRIIKESVRKNLYELTGSAGWEKEEEDEFDADWKEEKPTPEPKHKKAARDAAEREGKRKAPYQKQKHAAPADDKDKARQAKEKADAMMQYQQELQNILHEIHTLNESYDDGILKVDAVTEAVDAASHAAMDSHEAEYSVYASLIEARRRRGRRLY